MATHPLHPHRPQPQAGHSCNLPVIFSSLLQSAAIVRNRKLRAAHAHTGSSGIWLQWGRGLPCMESSHGVMRPTACRGAFQQGSLRPAAQWSRRLPAHTRACALGFQASPTLAAWEQSHCGAGIQQLSEPLRRPGARHCKFSTSAQGPEPLRGACLGVSRPVRVSLPYIVSTRRTSLRVCNSQALALTTTHAAARLRCV